MTRGSPRQWLRPTAAGLEVVPGGFVIDPVTPVQRAVITHGHGDHARPGHGAVLATDATLQTMAARFGPRPCAQALPYGERLKIGQVSLHLEPAGHILGSAQVVLDYAGSRAVISGDYKRRRDPTCAPFVPVACDLFVTEATFALPVFCHPQDKTEIARLLHSVRLFPERTHLVGVYALGKAQRVIMLLREAGYHAPIFIHGALRSLCELYRSFGLDLGELSSVEGRAADALKGQIVLCPPSALADRWSRRLADPLACMASGWMRIRGRAKQRGVELPLVISDHADWNELLQTVRDVSPQEVWITHGREEALVHALGGMGVAARALSLVGYEDEDEEPS